MSEYGMLVVELMQGQRVVTHCEGPAQQILCTDELLEAMASTGWLRGDVYWFDSIGQWVYVEREVQPEGLPDGTRVLDRTSLPPID